MNRCEWLNVYVYKFLFHYNIERRDAGEWRERKKDFRNFLNEFFSHLVLTSNFSEAFKTDSEVNSCTSFFSSSWTTVVGWSLIVYSRDSCVFMNIRSRLSFLFSHFFTSPNLKLFSRIALLHNEQYRFRMFGATSNLDFHESPWKFRPNKSGFISISLWFRLQKFLAK